MYFVVPTDSLSVNEIYILSYKIVHHGKYSMEKIWLKKSILNLLQ